MGWKNGMYWLKGILLSILIHMVVSLIIVFYMYLTSYVIHPLQGTNYAGFGISLFLFFLVPLSLVIIIPVGVILGFIYGRYKNKLLIWIPIIIYLLILFFYFSRF